MKAIICMVGVCAMLCFVISAIYYSVEGGLMGNKEYKPKHEKEWPEIIKAAQRNGLEPSEVILLLAMREAEDGPKGFEFGEVPVKGTNLDKQAGFAADGIRRNRERYQALLQTGEYKGSRRTVSLKEHFPKDKPDFIDFMGSYGAPTGYGRTPVAKEIQGELSEAEIKLNPNWVPNMQKIHKNLQVYLEKKGMPKGD